MAGVPNHRDGWRPPQLLLTERMAAVAVDPYDVVAGLCSETMPISSAGMKRERERG